MNYQEALAYLEELNVFGSRLGLVRIERLTRLLGMPQNKYKTIHVTGTNGKGSVTAMLSAMLQAAGLRVGVYTSPHLVSYTERMVINGKEISETDFALHLTAVKKAVEQMLAEGEESPTQFEVLTALGFLYFAEAKVDYAVIEVGLGGLLDSTNVILPEVAVITNVALEHADKCGGTLTGVARHKAGIIKACRPVVTGAAGEPLEIIRTTAEEKQAPIYCLGRDFSVTCQEFSEGGQSFRYGFKEEVLAGRLSLLGAHQLHNAAVALTAILVLQAKEKRLQGKQVEGALASVSWPGRFELIQWGKQKILIDGAHNPAGMTVLRQGIEDYFPVTPRVYLLGILEDKAVEEMLHILLRPGDVVVVTPPDSDRAGTAQGLAARVKVCEVHAEEDNAKALQLARSLAGNDKLLCCAGSLYLIGGIRKMILEGAACGDKQ